MRFARINMYEVSEMDEEHKWPVSEQIILCSLSLSFFCLNVSMNEVDRPLLPLLRTDFVIKFRFYFRKRLATYTYHKPNSIGIAYLFLLHSNHGE